MIGAIAADLRIDRGQDGTHVRFRVPVPVPGPPPAPTRARTADRPVEEPASVRTVGDRLVVTGDVDLDGRDAIGPTLLAAAACPAPCVVDLTSVRYLSSAGVALLAEAAALAGPRLSIVVAPGSAPARVCALTGLGAVVPRQRRTSRGRHRIGSAARSNWRASPVRGDHRVPQAGHSERDYLQNAQGEDVVAGIRNTVPLAQLEEIDKSS